jgi:hypothetical protein
VAQSSGARTTLGELLDVAGGETVVMVYCARCGDRLREYVASSLHLDEPGAIEFVHRRHKERPLEAPYRTDDPRELSLVTQAGIEPEGIVDDDVAVYYRRRCGCGSNDKRPAIKLRHLEVDPRTDPPTVWF